MVNTSSKVSSSMDREMGEVVTTLGFIKKSVEQIEKTMIRTDMFNEVKALLKSHEERLNTIDKWRSKMIGIVSVVVFGIIVLSNILSPVFKNVLEKVFGK